MSKHQPISHAARKAYKARWRRRTDWMPGRSLAIANAAFERHKLRMSARLHAKPTNFSYRETPKPAAPKKPKFALRLARKLIGIFKLRAVAV